MLSRYSIALPNADLQLNKEIYDQRINDKLGLMLAGMAKIFVADMVELGKPVLKISTTPQPIQRWPS